MRSAADRGALRWGGVNPKARVIAGGVVRDGAACCREIERACGTTSGRGEALADEGLMWVTHTRHTRTHVTESEERRRCGGGVSRWEDMDGLQGYTGRSSGSRVDVVL